MSNKKLRVRDGIESDADIISATSVQAPTFKGALDGNAATATKLATARTLALAGDATGSISFDGTANRTITLTLVATGVTAGTYRSVVVDAKGRVTGGTNPTITLTGDVTGSGGTTIATTLRDTGVVPGTYNTVVVDAKGRITGATNVTPGAPAFLTIAMSDADLSLTASQQANGMIVLTGSLTGYRYVNLLAGVQKTALTIRNNTTGGYPVILRVLNGGATVSVESGMARTVHCDGTNVVEAISAMGSIFVGNGNVTIGSTVIPTASGQTILTLDHPANGGALDLRKNGSRYAALTITTNNALNINALAGAINFLTSNTTRMTLASNGKLGIGTNAPAYQLAVAGDGGEVSETDPGNGTTWRNAAISIANTNPNALRTWSLSTRINGTLHLADDTSGRTRLSIDALGNLYVGDATGNQIANFGMVLRAHAAASGDVRLVPGDASYSGHLAFYGPDGLTRCGIVGRADADTTHIDADGNQLAFTTGGGTGRAFLTKGGRFYVPTGEVINVSNYGYVSGNSSAPTGFFSGSVSVPVGLHTEHRAIALEFNAYSDERYKTDIKDITDAEGVDFVRRVSPKTFHLKDDASGELKSGYIAQEVAKSGDYAHMVEPHRHAGLPEVTDVDGFTSPADVGLSINYLEAIPYLHAALRHALARIAELEAKLGMRDREPGRPPQAP